MPRQGYQWWHLIFGTHCSWLPGDGRGFRNRDHRIHSPGDYRNPPPEDEHEYLRRYVESRSAGRVTIPRVMRREVAIGLRDILLWKGCRVLCLSVGGCHVHGLVEMPTDEPVFNKIVGAAKQSASRKLTSVLPGKVFARDDLHRRIKDRKHQERVFRYIVDEQGPGAAVWRFDRAG